MGTGWTRRRRCIKCSTIFSQDTMKALQWIRSAGWYRNRQPVTRKSEALLFESTDLGVLRRVSVYTFEYSRLRKAKEKVKIMLYKCLIRQHTMEAWDGMVVQLHASWLGHTTEVSSRASRPGRCDIWERAAAYRMKWVGSGACLDTLEDRKIFAPDKNHPPYSIFAKTIELTQVPLSDIEDTRHRWENKLKKINLLFHARTHDFIVYFYSVCNLFNLQISLF
jgi:hypothetical protein